MFMRFVIAALSLFLFTASGQEAKEGNAGDAQKMVKLHQIVAEGTRFEVASVLRLAQIKVGDEVNFMTLQSALHKVTLSGLISNIDFEYESLRDSVTEVILHMKCTDAKPLATASIRIANVNEEQVWTWLTQVDPLFSRELPPNQAAIRLYSNWIGKFMESHGDPKFKENFAIVADASSSTGGTVPDRLVFREEKLRSLH